MSPGPVLIRRFVRSSKNVPLVDQVELLDANPTYANIRYSGHESTVSIRDLALLPEVRSLVKVIKNLTIMRQPLLTNGICCQVMKQTRPLLKMIVLKRRFLMLWRRQHLLQYREGLCGPISLQLDMAGINFVQCFSFQNKCIVINLIRCTLVFS